MYIFVQLNPAYYYPDRDTADSLLKKAAIAADFIKSHKGNPLFLACSVKEEVYAKDVTKLAEYHKMILAKEPDASLSMLHNNLPAASSHPEPYPKYLGTDRYGFFWEYSGNGVGYLASPQYALNWTWSQAAAYYNEAAKRDAEFFLVTSATSISMPLRAWNHADEESFQKYLKTLPEDRQADAVKAHKKAMFLAENGLQGWKKFKSASGEVAYNNWKWYNPPPICMKAMAWISVVEGARLFGVFYYAPNSAESLLKNDFEKAAFATNKLGECAYSNLSGPPGRPPLLLEAYGEAAREIMPYSKIICGMLKLKGSPLITSTKDAGVRGFTYPGVKGYIAVVYNNKIGACSSCDKLLYTSTQDNVRIDDQGDLIGFVPASKPRDIELATTYMEPSFKVFDLESGNELRCVNDKYRVPINPGSGKFLFVGPPEEATKLHKMISADKNIAGE